MDFKQYRGKNILAWLSYNANYEDPYGGVNRVCYVYPRVLMKGADYDLVDPADFPTLGRIEVRIQGGDSAEDVYSDFGSLVHSTTLIISKKPRNTGKLRDRDTEFTTDLLHSDRALTRCSFP